MKDLIMVYKIYGKKIGFIAVGLFVILPVNMMVRFAWDGYVYDMSLSNVVRDMVDISLLIMFSSILKNNNTKTFSVFMPMFMTSAILEFIIFGLNSITTILMIIERLLS